MDRVIYKYKVGDTFPSNGVVRHIGYQGDKVFAWVELPADAALCSVELSELVMIGTGQTFCGDNLQHVGTLFEGKYVWHFYRREL